MARTNLVSILALLLLIFCHVATSGSTAVDNDERVSSEAQSLAVWKGFRQLDGHESRCVFHCRRKTEKALLRAGMATGEGSSNISCPGAVAVLGVSVFYYVGVDSLLPLPIANVTAFAVALCESNPRRFPAQYCRRECEGGGAGASNGTETGGSNSTVTTPPEFRSLAQDLLRNTSAPPSLLNCTCYQTDVTSSAVSSDSAGCACYVQFADSNTSYYFFADNVLVSPPIAPTSPLYPLGPLIIDIGDAPRVFLLNCSCSSTKSVVGGSSISTNCTVEFNNAQAAALVPTVVVSPGVFTSGVGPLSAADEVLGDSDSLFSSFVPFPDEEQHYSLADSDAAPQSYLRGY